MLDTLEGSPALAGKDCLDITFIGGQHPVLGTGTVDGRPFCFRARGHRWFVQVGSPAAFQPGCWVFSDTVGAAGAFEAGAMTILAAERCIKSAIDAYRAAAAVANGLPPANSPWDSGLW